MGIMIISHCLCCHFLLREGLLLLLQHEFPSTGGIHELLKCESLPRATVLHPSMGWSQGHRSLQHTHSNVGSSLQGSTRSCQACPSGSCPQVSHVLQECSPLYNGSPLCAQCHTSFKNILLSTTSLLCELQVDFCSTMASVGCRDTAASL